MTSSNAAPSPSPTDDSAPDRANDVERLREMREHRAEVLHRLCDATDVGVLGRQVHPVDSGVPGTYYVNQRQAGPWD